MCCNFCCWKKIGKQFVKNIKNFIICSRARLVAEQWFSQAQPVRGAGDRQQEHSQNGAPEEYLHAQVWRGVHGAGDAQLDPAVPLLRPLELPQGLTDWWTNRISQSNITALQRPMREFRAEHGSAVRKQVRESADEERRASVCAQWPEYWLD